MTESEVQVRRIYDAPERSDGARVLVDRLWPRGMSKDSAELTEWCKDIAPSTELRKWYAHDPEKFDEFAARYRDELHASPAAEALAHLRALVSDGAVTLLTAAKRADISEATVLQELLTAPE
ncbi:DUF488 family protein [Microbacterium sp. H1-D42]|uniref:DUF488 domain-containing protein n=1 Tax=Microbacterium sp. H1-D42 TaxID=2925844 RepID=UPI001F53236B|nr:DUF488 family protein [Microbacterium sp. H1-D42]UNK72065.1 DUF488 family protein [Microbacterium sp. H1-D42]